MFKYFCKSLLYAKNENQTIYQRKKYLPEQIESICRHKSNVAEIMISVSAMKGQKTFWKSGKCWLRAFSPFLNFFFQKASSIELLTHYQRTNFRLFQTERVCRRQFQI